MKADIDQWIDSEGLSNLVSIVVPTRNRAKLLRETLESLVEQTYRPLEIVVVGDGIEDDTAEVVAGIQASTSDEVTFKYITQERTGAPAARNRGAQHTTGEYIVFMDDDDIPSNDFVSSRVDALRGSDANMAFGPWRPFVVDEQGRYGLLRIHGEFSSGDVSAWLSFLKNSDLLLQGCILRRSLVSRVGPWQTDLHKSQDLDYKARLSAEPCCRPVYCDTGLVFYRLHENSISGDVDTAKLDSYVKVLHQVEALGVSRSDYEQTRGQLADYFWFHAFWLYGKGDFVRGYHVLRRAQKHSPGICRSKGLLPWLLHGLGLDMAIGPMYFYLSQTKKALGLSKRKYAETKQNLVAVHDEAHD